MQRLVLVRDVQQLLHCLLLANRPQLASKLGFEIPLMCSTGRRIPTTSRKNQGYQTFYRASPLKAGDVSESERT